MLLEARASTVKKPVVTTVNGVRPDGKPASHSITTSKKRVEQEKKKPAKQPTLFPG